MILKFSICSFISELSHALKTCSINGDTTIFPSLSSFTASIRKLLG